jgi:hypothetical protein
MANSLDGATWGLRDFPFTGFPAKVAYGNGLYVGGADSFFVSPDGTNWHASVVPGTRPVSAVAYGNNEFVAVAPGIAVYVSVDATNWITHPLPDPEITLTDIAFGKGTFVASGYKAGEGVILYSHDAVSWSSAPVQEFGARSVLSVAFGEGWFVAAGDSGAILSSQDGITWTKHFTDTLSGFTSVRFDGGRFVAVGNYGAVFESSILPTLKISPPDGSHHPAVRLRGRADHVYSVETTPTLNTPIWKELVRLTNSTGQSEFSSSNSESPSQFFRSRELSNGSD